jgi:hypothetical protein
MYSRRPTPLDRWACALGGHRYENHWCTRCGDWDAAGAMESIMERHKHILTGERSR